MYPLVCILVQTPVRPQNLDDYAPYNNIVAILPKKFYDSCSLYVILISWDYKKDLCLRQLTKELYMAKKTVAEVEKAMDVEYKPSLDINEKMYPKIKDLKVDDVINLSLKVKITSVSRDRWNQNKLSVRGDILNATSKNMDEDYDD